MKSFKQFILEFDSNIDLDHAAKLIARDCKPFIKEVDGEPAVYPLYRGMKEVTTLKPIAVRKDRKPRNTPLGLHKVIDEWFNEHFGYRYRSNGLFCTGDMITTEFYGDLHIVFPIGNLSYVWSEKYMDLFTKMGHHPEIIKYNDKFDWESKELQNDIDAIMSVGNYHDTNLTKAISEISEIMIGCDYYYAIPIDALGGRYNKELPKNLYEFGEKIKEQL